MKKFLLIGLTSTLFLAACNNNENEDTKKTASKSETEMSKKDKAEEAKKKIEKQKEKKDTATTEKPTTEKATTEDATTEETTTESPKLDVNNISNRNDLESIIYGEYSEMNKITAYKNAVESGIIPQGNVMEGSAVNAYESSLRVESGAEESVYDSNPYPDNPNTEKYDHLYSKDSEASSTSDESEAPSDNPYINMPNQEWRYNTGDGLSSGEKQTKQQILNGTYEGDDGEQILEALDYFQKKYGNQ